jgi:hypothetical protein
MPGVVTYLEAQSDGVHKLPWHVEVLDVVDHLDARLVPHQHLRHRLWPNKLKQTQHPARIEGEAWQQ